MEGDGLMADTGVLCIDCLNPCDAWEYEYGKPDCVARQAPNPVSRWGIPLDAANHETKRGRDDE